MLNKEVYAVNFGLKEGVSKYYQVEQRIGYTINNFEYYNEIKTDVKVSVQQKLDATALFLIQILNYWQLDSKGFSAIDINLAQLRKNLLIKTDVTGNIQQVVNLDDMKYEWQKIKPVVAKKFKNLEKEKDLINHAISLLYVEGKIDNIISSSYLYHGILPGLQMCCFNKKSNYTNYSNRQIPNAIGKISLPFKTEILLAECDDWLNTCTIKINGEIDRENFNQDEVNEMFRELLDIYNLNAHVEGFHLESYDYDKNSLPLQSSQVTQYAIEGVLMYSNSCIITTLDN